MSVKKPIIGLYQDNEDAAKVIAMLVEKGYTEEEIFVLAEDPDYFADAIEEKKALVECGIDERDIDEYMDHLEEGDVLVVIDPAKDYYSETLHIVRQVSEQAPHRCQCDKKNARAERVVDYFGQKLLHKKKTKDHPSHVDEKGETICDVCQGVISPDSVIEDANRLVRDYMGQPLFRKKHTDPDDLDIET